MEAEEIASQIEDLGGTIDDLEESLAPIIKQGLSASSNKLPLLDKAKLYILATYALESVLFSALRLNGVDAKSHAIFKEIIRVKQYFQKVENLEKESAGTKGRAPLDKEAAGRFIKHGLAGNEQYDRERKERLDNQLAGAKRKLETMEGPGNHTRFSHVAKKIQASEGEAGSTSEQDSESLSRKEKKKAAKAEKLEKLEKRDKNADKEADKKAEKRDKQWQEETERREKKKQDKAIHQEEAQDATDAGDNMTTTDGDTPQKPKGPRTQKETFQALLQGPLPPSQSQKKRDKKHRKKDKAARGGRDESAAEG